MIKRRAYIKRTKPISTVRVKARRGPMRNAEYREFVRMHPCVACRIGCSCLGKCNGTDACVGVAVDAAHTRNNGMRSKGPDSSCAPLCRKHHTEYDAGRKAFERKYGVDMKGIASGYYAQYQKELIARHTWMPPEVVVAAKLYVDKQIETMKRYDSAPEEDLSEEEYDNLVEEIVDAIAIAIAKSEGRS